MGRIRDDTAADALRLFIMRKGLRQTAQRQRILDVLVRSRRHLSVQELHDRVRRKNKHIGYATVARTVNLLLEAGICREVDFADGVRRYELKLGHEHHDHLVCVSCGRIEEIYSEDIERLQRNLVRKYGYVEQSHKLDIFGICPRCRTRAGTG